MKRLIYTISFSLIVSIAVISAVPKPGPMTILTLENKMIHQDGYLYLNGLTNFYDYYLIAKSYDTVVNSAEDLTVRPIDAPKTQLSIYEIRQDRYEFTVVACDFATSGIMDIVRKRTLVFPLCAKNEYGTNWAVNTIIEKQIKDCMMDSTGVSCQKQLFMLIMRGNEGEDKAKIKKPPSLEYLSIYEIFH